MSTAVHSRIPSCLANVVAGFLEPQEIVSAANTCKRWKADYTADVIWRRVFGQTHSEYVQLDRSIQEGRYVQSTRNVVGQQSFTHRLSNCFLIDKEVYGMQGELICTIKWEGISGVHPTATHVTANELLIIDSRNDDKHNIYVFSKAGEFLRCLEFPKATFSSLIGILENPNLLIFDGEESLSNSSRNVFRRRGGRAIFGYDFVKTRQFGYRIPSQSFYHYFCPQTRSFFYCDRIGVNEVAITPGNVGTEKLFNQPNWSRPEGFAGAPHTAGICANNQMVCIYSNSGEIYGYDYRSRKELLHEVLSARHNNLPYGADVIRQMSAVGRKLLVQHSSYHPDQLLLTCLQVDAKSLGYVSKTIINSSEKLHIFPFVNSFFVLSNQSDAASAQEHCLALHNGQGKQVATFSVQPLMDFHIDPRQCDVTPFHYNQRGQVVIPDRMRLIFLDFQKHAAPQENKGA